MLKAAFMGALAAGLIIAACSPFGGASIFSCEQDSQCTTNGSCKQPEGLCVYPNAACASGQEYGPHSGSMSGKCVGDDVAPPDVPIDAPTMCTPNEKTCFNHALETCKPSGDGFDPAQKEQCALTCTTTGTPTCVGAATNIALADQQACNATGMALALSPATGATIAISQTDITCAPMCNAGGTTTIPRTSATPNNFFCLAAINIPSGVTITVNANVTNPVTLFSHGAVVLNSNITFDGGNATGVLDTNANNDVAGAGGPGGGAGGTIVSNDLDGTPGTGNGTCGGRGGTNTGMAGTGIGGGGGGGGNGSVGGAGGDGINAATGGAGGTAITCSSPELKPLVGGAGGGGGADGACGANVPCGWPGGGGGGALQIVSRSMITGTGTISANGGNGFGEGTQAGGGGGGGAGGGLLLEAPTINFTGTLRVNGGTGGRSESQAAGGTGASGANAATDGPDANATGGGTGGGGGGGRIRINGNNATAASCTAGNASPAASCTTGAIRTTP